MKIKKSQLKRIIKEEIKNILLKEGPWDDIIRGGRGIFRSLTPSRTRPGRRPPSVPELPQGTTQTDVPLDIAQDIVDQDFSAPLTPDDPEYWRRQHRADVDVPEEGGEVVDLIDEPPDWPDPSESEPWSDIADEDLVQTEISPPVSGPVDDLARRLARQRRAADKAWGESGLDRTAVGNRLMNDPNSGWYQNNQIHTLLDALTPDQARNMGLLRPTLVREMLYKEIERILNENI